MSEKGLNERFNRLHAGGSFSPYLGVPSRETPVKDLDTSAYKSIYDVRNQTPLNNSKSKQKKKLFIDDHKPFPSEVPWLEVSFSPMNVSLCRKNTPLMTQATETSGMDFSYEMQASFKASHLNEASFNFLSPIVRQSEDQVMVDDCTQSLHEERDEERGEVFKIRDHQLEEEVEAGDDGEDADSGRGCTKSDSSSNQVIVRMDSEAETCSDSGCLEDRMACFTSPFHRLVFKTSTPSHV
jgi:hypothetical protein